MAADKMQGIFTAWFDRLVKNKMVALAIPICGLALSCFLLSFAKLFSDLTFAVINIMSLVIFVISCLQFLSVSCYLIMIHTKWVPIRTRSSGGKAVASADVVPSTVIEDQAATRIIQT
jgi:hypothetical protein